MDESLISQEHLQQIRNWLGSGSINIFGLPFAGKDTHGHTLSTLLDAPLLGGGDILRSSVIPPEAQMAMDAGDLIPTEMFVNIVLPYLSGEDLAGKPLVLSSVGRWIGEEQGVLKATTAAGHPIKAVIYLHLSEEMVHKRYEMSLELGDRGNRADDEAHKLETRINEFNTKTLPVIDEYRKLNLLIEVNSDAPKEEVLENILARLFKTASEQA